MSVNRPENIDPLLSLAGYPEGLCEPVPDIDGIDRNDRAIFIGNGSGGVLKIVDAGSVANRRACIASKDPSSRDRGFPVVDYMGEQAS